MGYMVVTIAGGDGHLGAGLKLAEAFNRIMAFAHCDYIFHRIGGVMHLSLHHIDGVPDGCHDDDPELRTHYFPRYQSNLVDDGMARAEIMRMLVYTGFKGHYAMRDDQSPFPNRGGLNERGYRLIEHASFRI